MQTFTAPVTGNYKLEVWGAQGDGGIPGGKGGYTCGYLTLNLPDNLYVCVGGRPYNGGGAPQYPGGLVGGGASHIAITDRGVLKNYETYQSEVIIVAGGGGGFDYSGEPAGAGGGESGTQGSLANSQGTSSGGGMSSTDGNYGNIIVNGSFGQGGYTVGRYTDHDDVGGCGGGGWYGGGGTAPIGGGGGGSGHINATLITNGTTISGNQTFPSPSGGTETGHEGNGYCIITWQQLPQ